MVQEESMNELDLKEKVSKLEEEMKWWKKRREPHESRNRYKEVSMHMSEEEVKRLKRRTQSFSVLGIQAQTPHTSYEGQVVSEYPQGPCPLAYNHALNSVLVWMRWQAHHKTHSLAIVVPTQAFNRKVQRTVQRKWTRLFSLNKEY
jgi:hypothetical protein